MTEIPKENAFDPQKWYELKYLAFRWNITPANLEKALVKAGAEVEPIAKGNKLVRLRNLGDGP